MNYTAPPYLFWVLLFVGLLIASLLTYFKDIKGKFLTITPFKYTIGLSGMTDYPKEPDGAYWLRLEVSRDAIGKPIDTLDLIIDGKPTPANPGYDKISTPFTVCFNVTDWKWKGNIQVDLKTCIKGNVRSLVRIPIDFDIEPGGFPRYL